MKSDEIEAKPVGKEASPLLKAYEERIKKEMRVILAEKDVSQKQVAYALETAGIKESPKGLSAKLNSGTFSAAYYLALKDVLAAL